MGDLRSYNGVVGLKEALKARDVGYLLVDTRLGLRISVR